MRDDTRAIAATRSQIRPDSDCVDGRLQLFKRRPFGVASGFSWSSMPGHVVDDRSLDARLMHESGRCVAE